MTTAAPRKAPARSSRAAVQVNVNDPERKAGAITAYIERQLESAFSKETTTPDDAKLRLRQTVKAFALQVLRADDATREQLIADTAAVALANGMILQLQNGVGEAKVTCKLSFTHPRQRPSC